MKENRNAQKIIAIIIAGVGTLFLIIMCMQLYDIYVYEQAMDYTYPGWWDASWRAAQLQSEYNGAFSRGFPFIMVCYPLES